MNNKRKPLIISLISVAVLVLAAAGVWFLWLKDYVKASNSAPVSVNPVTTIIGLDTGSSPRYSGIVEPQETYKINKDDSKTVKEVLVKKGDEVHPGDVLFRYDTEDTQEDLDQAKFDLESIAHEISTLKNQLKTLEEEKKKASKDDQYSYTVQIQALEVRIKQQENSSDKKSKEIEKLEAALENTDVLCEVDGVVKDVSSNSHNDNYGGVYGGGYYGGGGSDAFITILAMGDYRIKGTVSELNIFSLFIGQAVVVHSRIDSTQTWKGTIESIDKETASDNNQYDWGWGSSGESSSKYNFFVTLEAPEGLILGQHVYIEPDTGESTTVRTGIWLPSVYVGHDELGSFVWVRNDKEKLEKHVVILGEYDSETETYEIKSGVTRSDYIAYPTDELMEDMPTTTDAAALPGGGPMVKPVLGGDDNYGIDEGIMGGVEAGIDNGVNDGFVFDVEVDETNPDETADSDMYNGSEEGDG